MGATVSAAVSAAVRIPGGQTVAVTSPDQLPDMIVCVDCGGVCHRLNRGFEGGDQAGDVVSYRCEDCLDRWDLVAGDPEDLDEFG
ncbi:MAG: hypothetical protein M9952_08660 [Microthrixaceae bacterium]|nr:hypothetical protein [Microthrixaceae bacterium]